MSIHGTRARQSDFLRRVYQIASELGLSDQEVMAAFARELAALTEKAALKTDPRRRKRYIVLGAIGEVERWRRDNAVPFEHVIAVGPRGGSAMLRGLSGDFEVVTLPSWESVHPELMAKVEMHLAIIGMTQSPRDEGGGS